MTIKSVNAIGGGAYPSQNTEPKLPALKVTASSNDPGLNATIEGRTVELVGEATNHGIAPSVLTLNFDGHTVKLPLSSAMTAWEVRAQLQDALPKGYKVQFDMPLGRPNTRYASFEIVKTDSVRINNPQRIYDAFEAARAKGSNAGADLSRGELLRLVGAAKKGGFTAEEKKAVSASYAMLFDGARYHATEAAQRTYARLQERFDLPLTYVR